MNATYQSIIVSAVKAMTGAGFNTAPKIAAFLNDSKEPNSQARKDLKWLFAANSYHDDPQATDSSVSTKLRSYVGLAGGGETIQFNPATGVYSVS